MDPDGPVAWLLLIALIAASCGDDAAGSDGGGDAAFDSDVLDGAPADSAVSDASPDATVDSGPPPPGAGAITGISFDWATYRRLAPGSDNWPLTWCEDDHQYTSWGDGGGFGGTNSDGRVSLGVALGRIGHRVLRLEAAGPVD